MAKDVRLTTGGALRIRAYNETGSPELVEVSRNIVMRSHFVRYQYLTTDQDQEYFCAVFRDPTNGEHYAQPAEE